jgi:DNA-binding transcriptional regulator YiaG
MTHMTPATLHKIRRDHGLSVSDVAGILRIDDRATIVRWCDGVRPISGPASIVLEMLDNGELPARYSDTPA